MSRLDSMLNRTQCLTVSEIANYYGKSGRWLNKYLENKGLIYRCEKMWFACGYAREKKLCSHRIYETTTNYYFYDGPDIGPLEWTMEGRQYIHKLLKDDGIIKE